MIGVPLNGIDNSVTISLSIFVILSSKIILLFHYSFIYKGFWYLLKFCYPYCYQNIPSLGLFIFKN